MPNRFVSTAKLCLVAGLLLAALPAAYSQPTGYLFQLPGPNVPGSRFFSFIGDANPFTPLVDKNGPLSANQVLAKPDGTKFYFIGAGTGGVQSIDNTFSTFRSVNGIVGSATAAAITPDGKYLLVGGSDLYIVDTSNDQVLANTANITGTITGFAVSRNSKTAYVLTNSAFGSQVIAVNLSTRARDVTVGGAQGKYDLPFGGATSILLSPLGLLYVAEVNRVYEVDPTTLTQTPNGEIDIVATPGPLHATPDGTTIYFVNTTPETGGQSILKLTVTGHNITTWPPFTGTTPPHFDDAYIAGNARVFAYSSQTTTLWDITTSPLGGVVSQLSAVVPVQNILAVAVSNELPSAKFLYLLIANGNQTNIARIDLASNTVSIQAQDILNNGIFQYVGVPPQSGASGFIVYNNLQVVKGGGAALPLIARVLDPAGRPVNNATATFSTDAGNGVTIVTPTQPTNGDGYVQTAVTLPNTPGTYTITLTVGGASIPFTITVPGAGCGSNCTGFQQVTAIHGDGQMVLFGGSTSLGGQPLTIKVTDPNGKPLTNVPVAFAITAGAGNLVNTSTGTDANGLAQTDFSATAAPFAGASFQTMTINASCDQGSVDFTVVVYILPSDGSAQPEVHIIAPTLESGSTITATQGAALPNAAVADIYSAFLQQSPIPGVGIRIADGFDTTKDGPATCQPGGKSDNSGRASCTLVAACQTGTFGMYISVGEYKFFAATLKILKGAAASVALSQGNNQSGKAGDTLPQILYAVVNDPCGGPVSGVQGTWKVTSGSATLTNTVSTSDSAGRLSTKVVLGQIPGPVQITLTVANIGVVTFNATNTVVIQSVKVFSGSGQTGYTLAAFPQPVVFQVKDAQGNVLPGVNVSFSVASGSGSVNPPSALTDAQGRAATTVTAGATAGVITVTGSAGGISDSATVTSTPPGPQVTVGNIFNAAVDTVTGQKALGIVPCGLATAQGDGLATNLIGSVSGATLFGPLQTTVNGTSLTVNGIPAPILTLSNISGVQQVNFQTPCETPVGSATIVVTANGGTTTIPGVSVFLAQPGIFNYPGATGRPYGAIFSASDGSAVTNTNLAKKGGRYFFYATGLGQVTNPPTSTNRSGTGTQTVPSPVVVGLNNAGVATEPAQYAVGYVGIYIVYFTIPTTANSATDIKLDLQVLVNNQGVFANSVYLPGIL
jgi:uncharacterized protein (TIGR03437 family)